MFGFLASSPKKTRRGNNQIILGVEFGKQLGRSMVAICIVVPLIYPSVYAYIHIHIQTHIHIHLHLHIHIHIHIHTCTYMYAHTCTFISIYTCSRVHTYVFIHSFIHLLWGRPVCTCVQDGPRKPPRKESYQMKFVHNWIPKYNTKVEVSHKKKCYIGPILYLQYFPNRIRF